MNVSAADAALWRLAEDAPFIPAYDEAMKQVFIGITGM